MSRFLTCILILAVVIVITVPVGAENRVYFIPQQSNATYCNTTNVEIWVNATDYQSGAINLSYCETCANVTNWVRSGNFALGAWNHYVGGDYITFIGAGPLTGKYLIGTLTLHCINNSQEGCETALTFIQWGEYPSELVNSTGSPILTAWINGTFTCGNLTQCLGTCCNDSDCTDPFATNVNCSYCINQSKYWKPNQDSTCFDGDPTSELCLSDCPNCCDGSDNDFDTDIDFPADLECTCGLDPSEVDPMAPIPEASSFILLSIGLCALVLVVRWQRKK